MPNPEKDHKPIRAGDGHDEPRIHRVEISYRSIIAVVTTVACIWLLKVLLPILVVLVTALILVGTLNPFVEWIKRHGVNRYLAIALVFVGCATLLGLIAMIGYQEFESRVIVPRVYGRALRLSSALVVIALLVGGKLGGIIGALLALPFAAALRMLIEELRLELPGDDTDDRTIRARDARAERSYARASAGASPEEAAAMATTIANQTRESDGAEGKSPVEVPIIASDG